MANDIIFLRGEGALGRPLPNRDHVSALAFPLDNVDLPEGFSSSDRAKTVFSISEAEALGISASSTSGAMRHLHYQINQFFVKQPKGELLIYLYEPATGINTVVTAVVQANQNGEIRQLGIIADLEVQDGEGVVDGAVIVAAVNAAQTAANGARDNHKPLSILIATDNFEDPLDLATLPDLRATNSPNVSFVLGVSGSGLGLEYSWPGLGAVLGFVALSKVHESIGWVQKFNFSDGTEFEKAAIGYSDKLVTDATPLEALTNKGYVVFRKHVGIAGTYVYDSPTCALATSDYAFIENERTMDKATRVIRANVLPNLSMPLYIDQETGFLREDTVAYFEQQTKKGLDQMQRDGEISGSLVTINPEQQVLTTSKLEIGVKIVPVGVARQIEFKIGFALKVS